MKTDVSPMFLTYFMVNWDQMKQHESDQKCTDCSQTMLRTEAVVDQKGQAYEGYVCHKDKRVTWVRVS
jgi:hypothetical protein